MMKGWSQEDYDERKQRQNDGLADDEDRRLIKQYEEQGFTQTRLKEWDAAAERAQRVHARADTGEVLKRPKVNDSRDEWIAFAEAVNGTLPVDQWPIADPAVAKKDELVGIYRAFGEPAA